MTDADPDSSSAPQSPARPPLARGRRATLITGGAGFVGCNIADSLAADDHDVILYDALQRPGVERNVEWLTARHGGRIHVAVADIRDAETLNEAVRDADAVVHLAAQVAVTTSLEDPRLDFDVNAGGTLNLLEAVRRQPDPPPLVYASTNKVYGALEDVALKRLNDRYEPEDEMLRRAGIGESRPLDFHSPYGCSKGVADQYVRDYSRVFGLTTTVLRMSCIYGPRQFGTEDQGWVAHFLIRALSGEPITIFGDGRQVRDILHVRDAVAAYRACLAAPERVRGKIFNLGGGSANAVSLVAVLDAIQALAAGPVAVGHADWRPGDQLYYVSDTRELRATLGWQPRVAWREGLADLAAWLVAEGLAPERALKPEKVAV